MPSKLPNSKECIFVDFQAWKACILLFLLALFQFLIAGIASLIIALDEAGMKGGSNPGEFAESISLRIMTSLGGLTVGIPAAIASVYFLKLLLRLSGGIRFTIR